MFFKTKRAGVTIACLAWILAGVGAAPKARATRIQGDLQAAGQAALPEAPNPTARRVIGKIETIVGRTVTIAPVPGLHVTVLIPDDAHMVRIEPAQTSLEGSTPITVADLKVGDPISVQGVLSDDNSALVASSVILMKHAEPKAAEPVQKRPQGSDLVMMKEDWLKRGIGGVVTSVDDTAGIIKVAAATASGTRTIAVHQTSDTIVRRYAPDSVRIDDAQTGAFTQIQPGDLAQARGAHSRDGHDLTADEIIFGEFRNIIGTIDAVDVVNGKLTVTDRTSKQSLTVNVTMESQVRNLPATAAEDIASRLKAAVEENRAAAGGSRARGSTAPLPGAGFWLGAAQADFEQTVSQMPPAMLADLRAGETVMIVGTPNRDSGEVTAAILVGGVEPIVTTSLDSSVPVTIAPWDLGMEAGNEIVANP